MLDRRSFNTRFMAGAAAQIVMSSAAFASKTALPKARNVVLVHGLFADGSCWSEVIARLQPRGLNVTSVQNPLTTLPEAVAAATKVLDRQDGPTVFVGHSFSGMILTEAGVHPNVSALVYVAARAPDAGEDYTALAAKYPTPPASAANADCATTTMASIPAKTGADRVCVLRIIGASGSFAGFVWFFQAFSRSAPARAVVTPDLMNASSSSFIWSLCVVHSPCDAPL